MNIRQNKGIGLADAVIAVAVLMIFTGVVVSISYNIYIQSNFIKRNEQATNYIVEIFEYAKGIMYDDVNPDTIANYINNKYKNVKAINRKYSENEEKLNSYTIYINVDEKYKDYVKQIDVTVVYTLGGKNKTVNMQTLINK